MRALKKTVAGLSLIALTAFGANAQNANDNKLTFNDSAKTGLLEKKDLTTPVIQKVETSYGAVSSSWDKNVSVMIFHGKNDQISGERYAKGFANGFASSEKTNGNPIYATANYVPEFTDGNTYVSLYMDGNTWKYKGKSVFTPKAASMILPIFMADYVEKFGAYKILPDNVKPTLVTSLER